MDLRYFMEEQEALLRHQIAENIAYYRRQNGDTQAELAKKLNYSDKSVSKWERAEGTPDVFILWRIAQLYNITVQDLLGEKKVPQTGGKRILILLLSVGLAWLTATVLFCASKMSGLLSDRAWLLFIYALPVSGVIFTVFTSLWWSRLTQFLSGTLLLWGAGLSLVLSLHLQSSFLLFVLCGVLQVLLILFFLLKKKG